MSTLPTKQELISLVESMCEVQDRMLGARGMPEHIQRPHVDNIEALKAPDRRRWPWAPVTTPRRSRHPISLLNAPRSHLWAQQRRTVADAPLLLYWPRAYYAAWLPPSGFCLAFSALTSLPTWSSPIGRFNSSTISA